MTDYRATVAPADVEFVSVEELTEGDVIVNFTALGKNLDVAPTAARLRLRRTRYVEVRSMLSDGRVLSVNDDALMFALNVSARTWRVRRSYAR